MTNCCVIGCSDTAVEGEPGCATCLARFGPCRPSGDPCPSCGSLDKFDYDCPTCNPPYASARAARSG